VRPRLRCGRWLQDCEGEEFSGVDPQLGFLEPELAVVDVLDAPGDGSGSVLSSMGVLGLASSLNSMPARGAPVSLSLAVRTGSSRMQRLQ
jgi:hypothetical protein